MKNTCVRTVFSTIAFCIATVAFAQVGSSLRVTVPFDFIVSGQKMPAGDYLVEDSGQSGALILHAITSKQSAIVIGEPSSLRASDHAPSLKFERHNGEVHLVRVNDANGPSHIVAMRDPQ